MKLFCGVIFCGLIFCFSGCSNPPDSESMETTKLPVPSYIRHDKTAPAFYKGTLSWQNVEFILHSSSVGRIVTVGDEYPYSVPVSFAYFEGKIVVHSSAKGTKVANIKKDQRVCFTVDRFNEREGWASINIYGKANLVSDPVEKGKLMAKYAPAYDLPPDQVDAAVAKAEGKSMDIPIVMIEVIPEKITSRLMLLSPDRLKKSPYIDGVIPGQQELPSGGHGASTKPMPKDLIDWTLYSCSAGRLDIFPHSLGGSLTKYPDDWINSTLANYAYFNNKIYINLRGHFTETHGVTQNQKVSFSVDRFNKDRWLSVNVFGTVRLISDMSEMVLLIQKYTVAFNALDVDKIPEAVNAVKAPEGSVDENLERMSARILLIEITPSEITGRMNNVKLNVPKLPYTFQDKLLIIPETKDK